MAGYNKNDIAFDAMNKLTESKSDDFLTPKKIRRRESEYPRNEYGLLKHNEVKLLKKVFGSDQFEGDPYEFLEKRGIIKPYGTKGGGYENWPEESKKVYDILGRFTPREWGYSGNPFLAHEKMIDEEISKANLFNLKNIKKIDNY